MVGWLVGWLVGMWRYVNCGQSLSLSRNLHFFHICISFLLIIKVILKISFFLPLSDGESKHVWQWSHWVWRKHCSSTSGPPTPTPQSDFTRGPRWKWTVPFPRNHENGYCKRTAHRHADEVKPPNGYNPSSAQHRRSWASRIRNSLSTSRLSICRSSWAQWTSGLLGGGQMVFQRSQAHPRTESFWGSCLALLPIERDEPQLRCHRLFV